jgi:hypothetical protein
MVHESLGSVFVPDRSLELKCTFELSTPGTFGAKFLAPHIPWQFDLKTRPW